MNMRGVIIRDVTSVRGQVQSCSLTMFFRSSGVSFVDGQGETGSQGTKRMVARQRRLISYLERRLYRLSSVTPAGGVGCGKGFKRCRGSPLGHFCRVIILELQRRLLFFYCVFCTHTVTQETAGR